VLMAARRFGRLGQCTLQHRLSGFHQCLWPGTAVYVAVCNAIASATRLCSPCRWPRSGSCKRFRNYLVSKGHCRLLGTPTAHGTP
jgi:hypothetical protein